VRPSDESSTTAESALVENPVWYHTIELPGGVVTPGLVDLRQVAAKVLPGNLNGARVLDIGTFDGFWAFELERRGATVVAIDLDEVAEAQIPPNQRARVEAESTMFGVELGRGFRLAAGLTGSQVQRVNCSVLELDRDAIGGEVDLAFMGALLIHLRDPVQALERIRDVLRPNGELLQLETVSLRLSLMHPRQPVARLHTLETRFNWWLPNAATLEGYLQTAGFTDIRRRGMHRPPQQPPMGNWFLGLRSRRPG